MEEITMNNLKCYFTLICFVLLILGLSMLAQAASLVGHWTFESGEELKDLTGNFADLTLKGAEIADGQLDVTTGKWAIASPYAGPEIGEVTLMSWVSLDDLNVRAGSALTLDRINSDQFNGIIYAERQERRWMNGSSFFSRTEDADPGFEETETGVMIQMAITHEDDGGNHVRVYRNGELIGDYTMGNLATWPTNDGEVFFGKRHGNTDSGPGELDAHIEEARVYAGVLTQAEIQGLVNLTPVAPRGKLATSWAALKAK